MITQHLIAFNNDWKNVFVLFLSKNLKQQDDKTETCKEWEKEYRINFKNPTSDSVKKHGQSDNHKRPADLALKKELESKQYAENIRQNTLIEKSITKMNEKVRR